MNKQEDLKEKGNAEFKSGNHEEALKKYSEAIDMDPGNKNLAAVLYSNRATVLMAMKRYKEAVADCNKAIELNESYAKAFIKRAESYMQLEQYEDAARDFKQAKQLDPSAQLNQRIQEAEREHKKSLRKDYYKILEVEKTADDNEIKKAYKKLALKWHPDKNGQTEESRIAAESKFKDINEAYSVLSDPQKKKRFDMGADLDDDFGGGGFGGGGVDPNVIFRTFFGGGGGDDGFSQFGGGNPFGFSSGVGGFPGGGGFGNGGFSFKFNKR
jgi:DnaJ family protein C protein 7